GPERLQRGPAPGRPPAESAAAGSRADRLPPGRLSRLPAFPNLAARWGWACGPVSPASDVTLLNANTHARRERSVSTHETDGRARRRRARGAPPNARRRLSAMVAGAALLALGMVPLAQATTPAAPAPGQRTNLKVLLIGATGDEPAFGGWKAQLNREGV